MPDDLKMSWPTRSLRFRPRGFEPTAADKAFKAVQQKKAIEELWLLIAGIIAFLSVVRMLRLALRSLVRRRLVEPSPEKSEKSSPLEIVLPGRTGKASWRRIPAATASAFRVLAFRIHVPLPIGFVTLTELFFICGYTATMLSLTLTNTFDLQYWFFEDRAAHLASCQLPFIVALAGKNNIISWLTAFTLATILSVRFIRNAFFEFFLVSHIILVGFGDYFWPALVVWAFDRVLRTGRLLWNNRGKGASTEHEFSTATVELVSSDTIRLTLKRKFSWRPGQHAYVVLPTVSDLPTEAHPFTIASIPKGLDGTDGPAEKDVVFLIRGRRGFTGRLREHAERSGLTRVPAFVDGPYGCPPDLSRYCTCILVAAFSHASTSDHLAWISKTLNEALSAAQPTSLIVEPNIYITGPTCTLPERPRSSSYTPSDGSSTPTSPTDTEKDNFGKGLPVYSSLKIVHGRPSIRRILQEGIDSSTGPVSVDVSRLLSCKLTSPANVLKGAPSVTLHVETFGMSNTETFARDDARLLLELSLTGLCLLCPPDFSLVLRRAMSSGLHPSSQHLSTIEEVASSSVSPASNSPPMYDDSDDEEFVYPGTDAPATSGAEAVPEQSPPRAGTPTPEPLVKQTQHVQSPAPSKSHPSAAQLEALHAAAASGDLKRVQTEFRKAVRADDVDPFELANDASTRTGLTALHAAASRGYLDIVKWLVEECGAIPDIEDKEGETALHKAALNGHLQIIRYLLPEKSDVHAKDADGWTALHNACSKGYLDIVRWLCEHGGATSEIEGAPGVDVRSKGGYTPLMNAASKGHLPVVLYLLTKQSADPLVRNNWGETAYDVAAAVFEVWICEVRQSWRFEAEKWRNSAVPYNPLAVHTTVPLVLYENQRLDVRLKTLAVSGGRPKFSASGLGRRGRQAPFELVLPTPSESNGKKIGAWRSDVQLPLREDPFTLPKPGSSQEGADRSHFWLSDWTLDVTPPNVDAQDGWQYAHSFNDPHDEWVAEPPPQLERLLNGGGAVAPEQQPSQREHRLSSSRIPDMGKAPPPDGAMYHLVDGQLIPYIEHDGSEFGGSDGQEMAAMPSTGMSSQDYVARARYLVGTPQPDDRDTGSALEARRMIAKLERATNELRQGILSDDDAERRIQAEVLLNAYNRELERRRMAASAQGLLLSGQDDTTFDDDDDDDEEEFRYPGAPSPPLTARPPSIRSTTTDYFGRASGSSSRTPADLTPHLSQAPEFRVPTHEAPQKVFTPRWPAPVPHQVHAQWERDDAVSECRECRRRFTFLNRRESSAGASQQRVCRGCYDEVNATVPSGLHMSRANSMERIFIDQGRLSASSPTRGQSSSQLSDLAECPVCNVSLNDLGPAEVQESHVKSCLEGGSGTAPQTAKYLVYKLPAESALIGTECVICLEEFVKGSTVARLSCLCSFHNALLVSRNGKGDTCFVDADDARETFVVGLDDILAFDTVLLVVLVPPRGAALLLLFIVFLILVVILHERPHARIHLRAGEMLALEHFAAAPSPIEHLLLVLLFSDEGIM
ncbi:hypothetical protein ACG7TL_003974 [Trametes sanguinea]